MKTILTRGGIEFLAVFLGIALSLWVDDYREERELKERLNDDLIKIYNEVQANTVNIEKIIDLNENELVVDIGSNDGTLLKCYKKLNLNVLGVGTSSMINEPSALAAPPTASSKALIVIGVPGSNP